MRWVALCVLAWLPGCVSAPPRALETEDYGFEGESRFVWVRGPWEAIRPSTNVDEVIDQLCPAVMALPRATLRDYGQEYCGLIYSLGDGEYFASKPSPLSDIRLVGPARSKSCYSPSSVRDARGRASPLADYHGHPWAPSALSDRDRRANTQLWSIRIQFDSKCTLQKLIPYVHEDRPGEVYERRGKTWKLVGIIKPEDKASGLVTSVEGGE
ncbi:hypothetical protein [Hyalangium versicolor]|uniref:hypothetical protein n=1 Tax=Hyalangium versicolor TaxID=2861190 RepID=UPI001CCC3B66|nr:hypothetical protein [Hyalangium versicolor]